VRRLVPRGDALNCSAFNIRAASSGPAVSSATVTGFRFSTARASERLVGLHGIAARVPGGAQRVEPLLGEVAVPVGLVACLHRLVERDGLAEHPRALGVARGPVAGLAAVVGVAVGVVREVLDQQARRLGEVLRVVRGPRQLELRAGNLRLARELLTAAR
jgi:hypothetical protein